jgi:hypothetical protein
MTYLVYCLSNADNAVCTAYSSKVSQLRLVHMPLTALRHSLSSNHLLVATVAVCLPHKGQQRRQQLYAIGDLRSILADDLLHLQEANSERSDHVS